MLKPYLHSFDYIIVSFHIYCMIDVSLLWKPDYFICMTVQILISTAATFSIVILHVEKNANV